MLDKDGVAEHRITVGSDKYNDWLEGIYANKRYTADYSKVKQPYNDMKLQADNGIAKMPKLLGKYIILSQDELPTYLSLVFLGRNKAFS